MKIYKFYGEWCSPCKTLSKILEDFNKVKIVDIDVVEDVEKARQFNIRKVPVLVLVDDEDNELWRHNGLITKEELDDKIRDFGVE